MLFVPGVDRFLGRFGVMVCDASWKCGDRFSKLLLHGNPTFFPLSFRTLISTTFLPNRPRTLFQRKPFRPTMDKLAPEILAIIVSHLQPPLAPFVVISRKWQYAIETRTFSRLELTSEEDKLQHFKSILASPRRRQLVRSLQFHVRLVVPSEKRVWKLQSTREAAANNIMYTRAILDLFSILATWEHDPVLSLWISANSSIDGFEPPERQPQHPHNGEDEIWRIRNHLKYVNFDAKMMVDLGGLPSVPVVAAFEHNNYRHIDPAVFPVFCAALPRVEKMTWWFIAPPRRVPDLRRTFRLSAATSFLETAASSGLANLTTLNIAWEDADPRNHQFNPGNFLDPGSTSDRFSVAIRHISRLPSLRRLKLEGCFTISKEVFEDVNSNDIGEKLWPSLQTFVLEVSLTTPAGGWHFIGDPANALNVDERLSEFSDEEAAEFDSADSDTSDWEPQLAWKRADGMLPSFPYRCIPNPATFVPLLISLATTVRRMPALRELELGTTNWSTTVDMRTYYYAPGYPKRFVFGTDSFHLAHAQESRWVIWRQSTVERNNELESNWRIPPALRDALHETASDECILLLQC